MKSKLVAYLLWWFLGVIGAHKFYIGKTGMGVLYFFTFGLFGIGWFIDLFTLSGQVDLYNARYGQPKVGSAQQQSQNIVVNVTTPAGTVPEVRISAEKQVLALADQSSQLTLRQIVSRTSLDVDEAEEAVRKLVARGMAREQIAEDGKVLYDFN
ncbi:MAG: TM2 domain-containing protein [Spirochaetes bacterium]|nr:TM2 domain-containing protein [Spirochaetota bacterium]MBU0956981.1 TM2 domain-containing protein [Spirochaetota bacterium]